MCFCFFFCCCCKIIFASWMFGWKLQSAYYSWFVWKWFAICQKCESSWAVIMKCENEMNSNVSLDYDHCESCDAKWQRNPTFFKLNFMCVMCTKISWAMHLRRQLGISSMHLTYDICAKILHLHCSRWHFIVVNMLTAKLFTIIIKY